PRSRSTRTRASGRLGCPDPVLDLSQKSLRPVGPPPAVVASIGRSTGRWTARGGPEGSPAVRDAASRRIVALLAAVSIVAGACTSLGPTGTSSPGASGRARSPSPANPAGPPVG